MASIAAVIVTYQTRELLKKCLLALYTGAADLVPEPRVIVVDNASTDGTTKMVKNEFPDVELIVNSQNRGPASAFNQGISSAVTDADYILVLNSDVEILPGTLLNMHAFLETNPLVDGITCNLRNPDGSLQFTRTHVWRLRPLHFERRFGTEWIGTTCGMARASIFRQIGGYDENFYFFNEDLDWTERAKRNRCRFMYLPDAPVVHHGGQGRKHNMPRIVKELYASNIYYFKRHQHRQAWLALHLFLLNNKGQIVKLQKQLAAGQDQPREDQLRELLAAYAEARSRMQAEYRLERAPRIPYWPDKRS